MNIIEQVSIFNSSYLYYKLLICYTILLLLFLCYQDYLFYLYYDIIIEVT